MKTPYVIGIFALVVLVFFFDVLVTDRALLTVNPFRYEPWRSYASEHDLGARSSKTDCLTTYLPRRVELSRSISSGRFPLWNPYIYSGTPFLADPQARVLYPVSLLLTPVNPIDAMAYDIALHFLIAMVGMYVFLRAIRTTPVGSMVGALSYGLSSFFFLRTGHPTFIASASWIPFFFYGFELARRRQRRGTILLAVFFALGYLAGFPQILLFGVTALVIYAVLLGVDDACRGMAKRAWTSARIIGISGLLALLLVSVHLLPFWELISNSRGLGLGLAQMKLSYLAHPALLVRSVFPNLFGNPVDGTSWVPLVTGAGHGVRSGLMVYSGVGTLLAAMGSLVFIKESKRIRALVVILGLSIGVGTSAVMLRAAYVILPFIQYARIDRVAVVACFAVAALGGKAISMVSAEDRDRQKVYFLTVVVLVAVAAIVGSVFFIARGDLLLSSLTQAARSLPSDVWSRMRSDAVRGWLDNGGAQWLSYEAGQVVRGVVFIVLSAGLMAALAWPRIRTKGLRAGFAAAFLAVLVVDLGLVAKTYYVSQPRTSFFECDGIRTLRQIHGPPGSWRVVGARTKDKILPPNTNQIFGIHSLDGRCTVMPDAYADFMEADRRDGRRTGRGTQPDGYLVGPVTDLMSARYILSDRCEPDLLVSPLLRAIALDRELSRYVKIIHLGDESRLAVCQVAGDTASVDIHLPGVSRLDFSIGFDARGVQGDVRGDSITFVLTCTDGTREVRFERALDLYAEQGRWYPASLDVSGLGGTDVGIGLSVMSAGAGAAKSSAAGPIAGWSDLDLVLADCSIHSTGDGYELSMPMSGDAVGFTIESDAREIPLEVTYSDGGEVVRWIGLPPHMPSRQVTLPAGNSAGGTMLARSDSAFTIEGAKTVSTHSTGAVCDLVFDSDMYIYENFAAVEKGLCIDRNGITQEGAGGQATLRLGPLALNRGVRCGRCAIISYEPERVVLEVSAERDCFLVFQDTYYPGWKAFVDGEERVILRTDVGARAIELDKGDHRVVMVFHPFSLRLGLGLTCLGIILSIAYGTKKRFRQEDRQKA